jgi:molecular chaperone GrpE
MDKEKETTIEIEEVSEELSEFELLQKENSELKDRLFRALADLENDRKRFERDREEAMKFAITAFSRDLLAVSDNLLRALESVSKEALKENDTLKTLYEGVSMTEAELAKAFEKNKIEVINPQGDKFNHHEHQAMFEITETDEAEGTITQVLQRGYKLYGRLLRPAMVGVAKPKKTENA